MPARSVAARLVDMVEAIERIRETLDHLSLDAFEASWEKQWLVERGLEIHLQGKSSSARRH